MCVTMIRDCGALRTKKAELADLTRLRFSWIIQRPNGDEDLGCDS